MIEKKAIGSIVGNVLIIVLIVVAVGIFLGVYLRNIRNVANTDLPLCVGIDLKMVWCIGFVNGYPLPTGQSITGSGIYFVVERGSGGGEIRDLRFKIIDDVGNSKIERPVNFTTVGFSITTQYKKLVEHSTIEAALLPYDIFQSGIPCEVMVSAVVGDSNAICAPTSEPIKCQLYSPETNTAQAQIVPMPNCV